MDFTPRLRQIVMELLLEDQVLSAKTLAERIHVSKRTVQRELEYAGSSLKRKGLTLCSKTGKGIWLEGSKEDKEALLRILENQEVLDSADKEERRKRLTLELLKDQEPKKLYYFGNKFGVSEATVSKDMERIQGWFEQYQLTIVKKPGLGVAISGKEKDYRTAVREFIAQHLNTPMIRGMYEKTEATAPESVKSGNIKSVYQILDDEILKRVCTCFGSIRDERITRLTEESYIGLVLHVTIAIERVMKGEIIEDNPQLMEKLRDDRDFQLALLIVNSLEEEFETEIPNIELAYICLHIKGSKIQRSSGKTLYGLSEEAQEEILELVHGIIVAYDENLASILETDEEFVNGLAVHLRPTLVRLRNHMPIENPHLEEMKRDYPEIFQRCLYVARYMKAVTGLQIPEPEVGFLTIHFGAALVRLESERQRRRIVNIGLICASGIGISRLMASRLQSHMKSRVSITTYGKEDVTPYVIGKEDFFVSSMRMDEVEADVVSVSPLLPETDLAVIEQKVDFYEVQPRVRDQDPDFARQLEKVSSLSTHIKDILREFRCVKLPEALGFQATLDAMKERLFSNPACGELAAEDIRKREEIATQVIPEYGIALLHARTSGVVKPCICVGVPEKGKAFSHPYFQSIRAIVVMLIPRDESMEENSRLLGTVSQQLVEDEGFLELVKEGKEEEIRGRLSLVLKKYFHQYLDEVQS